MKKLVKVLSTAMVSSLLFSPLADAQSVKFYGPENKLNVSQIARYDSGTEYGESGTEIVSYDLKYHQAYSINGALNALDILDMSSLKQGRLTLKKRIFLKDLGIEGSDITSVAVNKKHHYIAVSIPAVDKTDKGHVAFLNHKGELLSYVETGSLPDMVTFTHNGKYLLAANEGEPNDSYDVNPEGSVSVMKVPHNGVVKQSDVKTVPFNPEMIGNDVRSLGRNDKENFNNLEPEYITVDDKNKFAYISIQERNAVAKFNIKKQAFVKVKGMGYKSYQDSKIDASDKDGGIKMKNYPIFGMYQPDGITQMKYKGKTYILTANEGDTQDYDGFSEETRIADIADKFNMNSEFLTGFDAAQLKDKKVLGRLKTSIFNPFEENGQYNAPVIFGGRSFSILDGQSLKMVFDSKDDFEAISAKAFPDEFNSDQEVPGKIEFDSRSDDKGPEPESIVTGEIDGKTYAFIGIERTGGIMVYDVTNPLKPQFESYFKANDNKDISPEGLTFIPAKDSPVKKPLLMASHEMSGTIAVYEFDAVKDNKHKKK